MKHKFFIHTIANYIRAIYVLDPLSSTNSFNHIAVDGCLFSRNLGLQIWAVGLIYFETNEIRLELAEQRNEGAESQSDCSSREGKPDLVRGSLP